MMKNEQKPHIKYRSDIDGLRAIAVLSVVFFHVFPGFLRGGFVGVDVFFVISGYLISTIIFQGRQNNTFSYVDFYIRRVKRIFPALVLILLFCLLFCVFAALPDEVPRIGLHIGGGAAFISNFVLGYESGYFDISAHLKPLLHLWSLAVEEQYYIFWPLLIGICSKRLHKFFPIICGLLMVSFLLNVCFVKVKPTAVFFLPVTRGWELLIGSLLAYITVFEHRLLLLFKKSLFVGSKAAEWRNDVFAWVGIGLILMALLLLSKDSVFPGWLALLPTLGAFFILLAGEGTWVNRVMLSNRLFVFFGLISYPLYLWHWPLLTFAKIIEGEELSVLASCGIISLSIVFSWLTYQFVEKPIRYGKQTYLKPVALSASVTCLGLIGMYLHSNNALFNFYRESPPIVRDLVWNNSSTTSYPCSEGLEAVNPTLKYCMKSKDHMPSAIIFGDSHAEHLFSGVATVDKTRTWLLAGHPSCPPVKDVLVESDMPQCQARSEGILELITQQDNIKTVVLSFFGAYTEESDFAADHIGRKNGAAATKITMRGQSDFNKSEKFWYGIEEAIITLEQAKKQVVVFIDVPELPFFPRNCLSRPFKRHVSFECSISKDIVLKRQANLRSAVEKLQSKHPNLRVFDPLAFMCDTKNCYAMHEDMLIYRDSHHLSVRGSEYLARYFIPWLNEQTILAEQVV